MQPSLCVKVNDSKDRYLWVKLVVAFTKKTSIWTLWDWKFTNLLIRRKEITIKKLPSSSFNETEKVEKIKTDKYKIFKYHKEFYQRISLHRLYSDRYKWKLKNNRSGKKHFSCRKCMTEDCCCKHTDLTKEANSTLNQEQWYVCVILICNLLRDQAEHLNENEFLKKVYSLANKPRNFAIFNESRTFFKIMLFSSS